MRERVATFLSIALLMHVCLEEEYSSAVYIYYYGVYKVGTSTRASLRRLPFISRS